MEKTYSVQEVRQGVGLEVAVQRNQLHTLTWEECLEQ